ncbi:MAG: hypothetical protein KatS3mg083_171 [Candidatus Dojkabacteria bacterium]|nr:MAG: hypothetical protein KatS3mg083_171 [Candidatus Dojkabacteria bacterium]
MYSASTSFLILVSLEIASMHSETGISTWLAMATIRQVLKKINGTGFDEKDPQHRLPGDQSGVPGFAGNHRYYSPY